MISFPNCKINIGLNILRKRPDGYHDIETLFLPLTLSDILEIVPGSKESEGIQLSVTGLEVDCIPEKNLCSKAYSLLKDDFDLPPVIAHLHKVIPSGAGLGGGSSDAAFMLKMLSQQFNLGIDEDGLCDYASRLGSDCAFFIKNRPLIGYGRGNLFRETLFNHAFKIVLIHPAIHVSTIDAYAGVKPMVPASGIEKHVSRNIEEWKERLKNDFEQTIFKKYPAIASIKEKLYNAGAAYASMSGSGSAVYGLFTENEPPLPDQFPGMFYWTGNLDYRL